MFYKNKPVSPVSWGIDLRVAAKGSKGLRVGLVRLGWVGWVGLGRLGWVGSVGLGWVSWVRLGLVRLGRVSWV